MIKSAEVRPLRIFAAGVDTETNTFAPWPTGLRGFEPELYHGDALTRSRSTGGQLARLYTAMASDIDAEVAVGLFAYAEPSGPTLQSVFEQFCGEITHQIRRDGPFDIVLMLMHGAMVATECDDCEGELLERIRAAAPAAVVGALLDPHSHLTERMVMQADLLIACKNYPHDDYEDRGRELFEACVRVRSGDLAPVSAVFDCLMIGGYPTTAEPMTKFVADMHEAERHPAIVSVSLIHGFPWGDTYDTGTKMLVIANGDEKLAEACAATLGRRFYDMRHLLRRTFLSPDEALVRAAALPGLVVLADVSDNPGGGAPGDNTELLRAILRHELRDVAIGSFWDPMTVLACADAGIGAKLPVRLGGKCGPASGNPLDLEVRVRSIVDDHQQTGLGGIASGMGMTVWLESQGVTIVVNALRNQIFHPDAFTGLGIDLSDMKMVAVKSTQHFRTSFDTIADHTFYLSAGGALNLDYATIPYVKRRALPFYPRQEDPLAGA